MTGSAAYARHADVSSVARARLDRAAASAAAVEAARDRHCVFPSCTRPPRHCDVHHVEHRGHGGPTRTSNGALLCRHHHRLLHEHGWTLAVEDGRWVATDPHGTTWTGRPRAPDPATAKTPR